MVRFFVCPVGNTTHQKNPVVIPNESMERSGMNEEESPWHALILVCNEDAFILKLHLLIGG